MSTDVKALFGAWTQAIGTVIAAVADTPSEALTPEQINDLGLYGNALQATGNGLLADTNAFGSLNQIGNAIQATGNTIIVGALALPWEENLEQNLIIKGNLFQAAGGSVSFNEDLKEDVSMAALYAVIGDFLQVVGNGIQAYAAIADFIVDDDEEFINAVGSWIQATGAVLSALSVSKSYTTSTTEEPNAEPLVSES
ncbi:DUF6944 family repetitive protein [Shouchella lehensis]|uniref:Uncharacterized protein n=1 Tax=Shouchella lehensis G1 TaxID=1246626 RepID=A0A060M7D7_9BACI|nr:hypothetical protein [Shouchella lehensis]AIC96463.1 hypothetical protein BleG1_3916 [Shouchella lehensis G1]RQW19044.1 hypothetical protein EH196_19045 [Bacillus sp. C1-1]